MPAVCLIQSLFGAECLRGKINLAQDVLGAKRMDGNREQAPKVIRLGLLWHGVA